MCEFEIQEIKKGHITGSPLPCHDLYPDSGHHVPDTKARHSNSIYQVNHSKLSIFVEFVVWADSGDLNRWVRSSLYFDSYWIRQGNRMRHNHGRSSRCPSEH